MQRFGVKLSFIGSHKVISFTSVTCSPLKIKPIDRLIEPTDNLQRCFKLQSAQDILCKFLNL